MITPGKAIPRTKEAPTLNDANRGQVYSSRIQRSVTCLNTETDTSFAERYTRLLDATTTCYIPYFRFSLLKPQFRTACTTSPFPLRRLVSPPDIHSNMLTRPPTPCEAGIQDCHVQHTRALLCAASGTKTRLSGQRSARMHRQNRLRFRS